MLCSPRSIALRAYNESGSPFGVGAWGDVLRSYSGARPGVADDVATLADLRTSSLGRDFSRGIMLHVSKPHALSGINDVQIETLAKRSAA
jgi:hypothetical protein